MHRFRFFKYGLGLILVFVDLKILWLNEAFGGKFPVTWSLGIVGGILAVTVTASLVWSRGTSAPPSGPVA